MEHETGKRILRTHAMTLHFPAGDIFPLLCPVREYDWLPHWHCRLVYSSSGFAELGCVFQTDFGDQYGCETWVVSQYETDRAIAFVRSGKDRTTRYTITLTPEHDTTTLLWQQELTGLSGQGNGWLTDDAADKEFSIMMQELEKLLCDYLMKTHKTVADTRDN